MIGGDKGMAGAAIHAATTAFASGAGLAKIAAHEVSIQAAQKLLPDALTVTKQTSDPTSSRSWPRPSTGPMPWYSVPAWAAVSTARLWSAPCSSGPTNRL